MEVPEAIAAAEAVAAAGGSPLQFLRAFAEATQGRIDDTIVAELEVALTTGLDVLIAAATFCADGAQALRELRERRTLDQAVGMLIDAGYAIGEVRATLERWRSQG